MLVHGMGTGGSVWAAEVDALSTRARVIVPDRRGYGATPAPEPYGSTTVTEQAEDLAALIEAAGAAPAVVAGADFGALACLDLALRHRALVRALVLADPYLLALVGEATEALAAERTALSERLRDDGPRAAMEAWLGRETEAAPGAFFADYGGLATLTVTRRELRALDLPVRVVIDPRAPAHVRAAAAALLGTLSDGREVPDVIGAVAELL